MAAAEHEVGWGDRVRAVVPILAWIRTYDRGRYLRPDVLAGVTVAAFSVPESMAYAGLAGLSPENGLYASMIALLIYALFGTSRQMSVGTTSALAIMVAGTLGTLSLADPEEYLAAAQLTAIFAGAIAIVAGLLRLGFVVNFISESVLTGFSAGAALYIGASQLSKLFGIEGVQGNFFERVWNVLTNLDETNGWTLALGLVSIALLLVLEERFPRLPVSLFVVIAAICLMYLTDLEDRGVSVAGDIPSGLPALSLPSVDASLLPALVGLAFGCFLLSYVEGISVARTFAARHKEPLDSGQELYANGAVNIASGLFKGLPVGGSMSRSAVNDAAGARTPLAGGVAAVLLAIVLLFLTAPFGKLPEATLAAVVLVAVRGLIDVPALRRLARVSRTEFAAALLTAGGVLLFGMLEGIVIGVLFCFFALLARASSPHTALLGRVPDTDHFAEIGADRRVDVVPDAIVFRADAGLFYANVERVRNDLLARIEAQKPPPKLVVFDLSSSPIVDLAAADMLAEVHEELSGRQIDLRIANANEAVRDLLRKDGLERRFGTIEAGTSVEAVIDRGTRGGTERTNS